MTTTPTRDAQPPADTTSSDAAASSQADVSAEIEAIAEEYQRDATDRPETQPRLDYPPYRSSILRHPTKDLHHTDPETMGRSSRTPAHQDVNVLRSDLTMGPGDEPIGERIRS